MKELENTLKALANNRRLAILKYLKKCKQAKVGHIADRIKLSFRSTSRHLAILYAAGIVEKEQNGLEVHYSIAKTQKSAAKAILTLV